MAKQMLLRYLKEYSKETPWHHAYSSFNSPWLCYEGGYWKWWGLAWLHCHTQKKPEASCKSNNRLRLRRWYCPPFRHSTSNPKLAVPSWNSCWLSRTPNERFKYQIHAWPTTSKKMSFWSPRQGTTWNKSKTSSILAHGLMNLKKTSRSARPLAGNHALKCAHSGSQPCLTPWRSASFVPP